MLCENFLDQKFCCANYAAKNVLDSASTGCHNKPYGVQQIAIKHDDKTNYFTTHRFTFVRQRLCDNQTT